MHKLILIYKETGLTLPFQYMYTLSSYWFLLELENTNK